MTGGQLPRPLHRHQHALGPRHGRGRWGRPLPADFEERVLAHDLAVFTPRELQAVPGVAQP
ncbi:MAG: hypothetical protein U5O69_02500 [Candidatus Competibacteraceae bacterium]|nr:hypothetical protein [Candidatus Competibacteraceae bacterium]